MDIYESIVSKVNDPITLAALALIVIGTVLLPLSKHVPKGKICMGSIHQQFDEDVLQDRIPGRFSPAQSFEVDLSAARRSLKRDKFHGDWNYSLTPRETT